MSPSGNNRGSRLIAALGALALIGGSLIPGASAAAQTDPAANTTSGSAGFSVTVPNLLTYYQQHGGIRTFGPALSHDFQLLGRRVQIFQNGVLEQQTDGSVRMFDLLGDALPITRAAGATYPAADPAMVSGEPSLASQTYTTHALSAIDAGVLDGDVPDSWSGLPVAFNTTFRTTLACSDVPSDQACDNRRQLAAALDVWGLPTSAPTGDPGNSDLVYQRFQRGIMQFSQTTGATQAVPLGLWFERVLEGGDLPDDLQEDVVGSRFYAQYAPALGLGVARPSDLPATSMVGAFNQSTTLFTAGFTPTPDPSASGTPVLAAALPTFGTATPTVFVAGTTSLSPTPASFVASNGPPTSNSTPGTPVSGVTSAVATPATPLGPDPCAGDEQILFAPKKPYVGTDVLVAVTSATHHDVRTVRLTGPVKTGPVNERPGLNGWVWEWTISPTMDGWYDFTFFVDGARACATSGFNALPAFGATAAPSVTLTPSQFATITPIPTPTASPTSTPVPAPVLASTGAIDPPSGACAGRLMRINGNNFGVTQAALNGNVLFAAASATSVATVLSWTNTTVLFTVPPGLGGGSAQIVVTTVVGASTPVAYQIGTC